MSTQKKVKKTKPKKTNQMSPSLTRLTEKAFSPLVIRKYTKWGFPLFVGVITDDDLDRLDAVVVKFVAKHISKWKSDSLQDKRNLAGMLSDEITKRFERTEGVAVTLWIDKACVTSLFGDFMNHLMCRLEYYTLLNMSTNI